MRNIYKVVLANVSLLFLIADGYSQAINGPTQVNVNEIASFTFSDPSGTYFPGGWECSNCSLLSDQSNGYPPTMEAKWETSGTYVIECIYLDNLGQIEDYISFQVQVLAVEAPTPTSPVVQSNSGGTVVLSWAPGKTPPSGVSWFWQSTSTGTSISNSGSTISLTVGTVYYLRARNNSSGTWSDNAGVVNFMIAPPPIWYLDSDGDGFGNTSPAVTSYTQPAGYVDNDADLCPAESGQYGGCPFENNHNYTHVISYKKPIDETDLTSSISVGDKNESFTYYDGIGRPVQNIAVRAGGEGGDIITHLEYDQYGRHATEFLSYGSTTGGGLFRGDARNETISFYNTAQYDNTNLPFGQKVFDQSPLNRVLEQYEAGDNWVGTKDQVNEIDRHGIKTKYWTNTLADSVRIWTVTNGAIGNGGSSVSANLMVSSRTSAQPSYTATSSTPFLDGFQSLPGDNFMASIVSGGGTVTDLITSSYSVTGVYQAGTLYKSVTEDEQDKQVIEFKDKEGKVILKKVQLTAAADIGNGSGYTGWMCTYYIYDDLNNLRCVIQPEGVKKLATTSWQLSAALLKEQCFRYEYDGRNRMIIKKAPGAAEVAMVYDVRDRLVMTQDGNLRSQGLWNFTGYDNLNRPVRTGLFNPQSNNPNTHWTAADSLKTGTTNEAISYPTATMLTGTTALTETFYDNYDWVNKPTYGISDSATFKNFDGVHNSYLLAASNISFPYAQTPGKDNRTRGLVTGSRANVLGTFGYITTLILYDDKGRPVQVKTINHTGGTDITTTQYSWSGQPLIVASKQEKSGNGPVSITTITRNNYDALGRLVQTAKNIINTTTGAQSGEKIIAQNAYDELGQLKIKKLGVNGGAPVETQVYDYNVRGWLLGMNRDYVNSATAATANKFGYELTYDKAASFGGAGGGLYNGNIATMSWRTSGNGGPIRRYNYSYDAASRIMSADYWQYSGSSFANTGAFSSQMGDGNPLNPESAYDYNGNIKSMTQQGLAGSSSILMDQLTYSYLPGSNKLAKVTDGAGDTRSYQLGDFNDGTNSGDDYAYDVNGNLTKDENKNISSISYNILNLPETISVTGKGTITYLYDASGNKLTKTVNEGSGQKITNYVGSMVFEGTTGSDLSFIGMEEGRFRSDGSTFMADYFLKDHLGNVRAMINENGTLLEETHYYPFGLSMSGISYKNPTPSLQNKDKTFQGQKFDDDLGLNYYSFKYRNHDPQIGRFIQIDPLADNYRYNTLYAFSENKVINGRELEGLEYVSIHHYANGNTKTESWYRSTDAAINKRQGTTAGVWNSASYGPLGRGVVHYYYDNNSRIYDTRWDQQQKGGTSDFAYHGLYSGPGSVTKDGGKSSNYDFSFQPIDWADAIAKRHDMDYAAAAGKDYVGFVDDIRTLQADKDMVKRVENIQADILNPFKKMGVDGVETPNRTSWSGEMDATLEGQRILIGALATYKQWKIDNGYTNKDKFKTLRKEFYEYDPITAGIIDAAR